MTTSTRRAEPVQLGGLWCHDVLALLTRHLDGDLSEDELAAVKAHVAGCDACARFGGAFANAIAKIRDSEDSVDDDDDDDGFSARVMAAIDAE